MKLAWYTPFSERSAIGRFSALVVGSLRRLGFDVSVVRSERKLPEIKSVPSLDDEKPVVWAADFDRQAERVLSEFDLVIYNVGDHFDYHAMCVHHQHRVPGLTILHDYILHHALYRFASVEGDVDATYRAHLQAECGAQGIEAFDQTIAERGEGEWWNQRIADFPVFRWALGSTYGVVTHAEFYRHQVELRLGCPTESIPLAYDSPLVAEDSVEPEHSPPFTISTFGSVNPNKRYHAVMQAISASPLLRESCHYRIVGAVEPQRREDLERFLSGLNPRPDVTFTGHVDEEDLARELRRADIISCLRYPALEGGSASVIEGLRSGRPIIVCDTGCYREIPDELVYKVDPHHEVSELTRHLERIVQKYPRAVSRARLAQQWVGKRHCPDAYAEALANFANMVLHQRPLMQVTDQIADQLRTWRVAPDSVLCERIDRAMEDLFDRSRPAGARQRAA